MESERYTTRCPCCGRLQSSLNSPNQEPLIHKYAYQNNSEELCKLLNAGVDPNAFTLLDASMICPLHRAAESGSVTCAQALVAHGACVNVRDGYGRTPLHIVTCTQAAECSHLEFIKFLISKGADKRCSANCRKCKMYCKLATRPGKKPSPAPAPDRVYEEYSSDEELDFASHLKKLKRILQGRVINRAGEVVPYK